MRIKALDTPNQEYTIYDFFYDDMIHKKIWIKLFIFNWTQIKNILHIHGVTKVSQLKMTAYIFQKYVCKQININIDYCELLKWIC